MIYSVHLCSIYQIWQLFDHLDDKIILASSSRPGWRQAVERDIVEARRVAFWVVEWSGWVFVTG